MSCRSGRVRRSLTARRRARGADAEGNREERERAGGGRCYRPDHRPHARDPQLEGASGGPHPAGARLPASDPRGGLRAGTRPSRDDPGIPRHPSGSRFAALLAEEASGWIPEYGPRRAWLRGLVQRLRHRGAGVDRSPSTPLVSDDRLLPPGDRNGARPAARPDPLQRLQHDVGGRCRAAHGRHGRRL